jgi:hypothetical protein
MSETPNQRLDSQRSICPFCGVGCGIQVLPGEEPGAALCTRCLRLHPVDDPPADTPEFTAISDAFPSNPEAAVPLAVLVGLLDSLARYRSEIGALLARVERAGTDPFLAVDRLADDPEVAAAADLRTRRRQLEQLL